jgi:ATP-dependent RNA helicase RhlE
LNLQSFADLPLAEPLKRALRSENYSTPTPIQAQAIPHLLAGRDLLGSAQTGTGKTAAFALPILHQFETNRQPARPGAPLGLVLSPTRELAVQIAESFKTYGQFVGFRQAVVYGGVPQNSQVRALKRGVHLVVATPGRLIDLMDQGHIQLGQLQTFVLDEADRMLDMGFMPALKRIISELPQKRQSLFFSATLPPNIIQLARHLLQNPVTIHVTPQETTVEKIDQRVLFVEHAGKRALLYDILNGVEVERALVFTKTKRMANTVAEKLIKSGIKATAIHGNKSQNARQRALEAFRRKQVQVLVATDVAARGIDIDGITHVVNFDLPMEPESYVHRIGRTGRAGAEGVALTFCTAGERRELRAIERLIGQKLLMANGEPQPIETKSASQQNEERTQSASRSPARRFRPKTHRSANAAGDGVPGKRRPRRAKPARSTSRIK